MPITASRSHLISAGHRVVGHEGKCQHLHGHNFAVTFDCRAVELDTVGRVLDFAAINSKLCQWLEDHWDHKMLLWENDPLLSSLRDINPDGIVSLPFNPTAEQLADYLLFEVGPKQLAGTGVVLIAVTVWETPKCSAQSTLTYAKMWGASDHDK